MKELKESYGIVLEGGGAKGAYQVGAWKALRELGVQIKGVVGTSIGALNGILMVQDDFDEAYKLWENLHFSQIIDVDDDLFTKMKTRALSYTDLHDVVGVFKDFILNSGFDITPLKTMVKERLKEEAVRASGIDYGLVTVSLSDFKSVEVFLEDIPKGLLEDYLVASAYLPVFKSEKLHGKKYLDGGVYNNLPVQMLIDKGYKDIIIIRLHGLGHIPKFKVPDGVNITYIEPEESLGGTLDLIKESALHNLALGYHDAMRIFKELKGNKYYFQLASEEPVYMHKFLQMPKRVEKWLRVTYGYSYLPRTRDIMENVLPAIAKRLDLKNGWDYIDLYAGIYEHVFKLSQLDRFKIYHEDELKNILENCTYEKDETGLLDKLINDRFDRAIFYLCKHWK